MRLRFPEFIESFGLKTLLQFGVIGPEFRPQMQRQSDIRCVLWIHILGEATGFDPCSDCDLRLADEGHAFAKFVESSEHRLFRKP